MAYKVLAIDDEEDILRLVRTKLKKEGFDVITAIDGEDGLEKVFETHPDIMIVDVRMPKKDGYEVVKETREKMGKKSPIIIMLTASVNPRDIIKGLEGGADDYITKPFSPRELIERINVALIKKGKDPVPFQK